MSTSSPKDFQPYRVRRRSDPTGPPLTVPQQQVLAALLKLCPGAAGDVGAREVADTAGLRHGAVVVILRSLTQRGLALRHEGAPEGWAPTMTGRARARHFRREPAGPR